MLVFVVFCGLARAADTIPAPASSPIAAKLGQLPDTAAVDSAALPDVPIVRQIVADRARIISPQIHTVISKDTVTYEIQPLLPVDSVMLFVRHSQTLVDTLGVFTSPPYRAVWDCSRVPDQDQIHLQFGYALFVGDTLVITSPPMPHRWALDRRGRERRASRKSYHLKQRVHIGAFEIDGDMSKWDDVKGEDIGDIAHFKMLWTGARLHFIVQVRDTSITLWDFVELHIDMHRDRAHFSGINHRSLRFGPRIRTRPFVVELTEDGFIHADSVNALLNDEIEWKGVIEDDGYIVEAAIPFAILADMLFPPTKFGFDISVTNADMNGDGVVSFYSWAGTERFFRYSPSGWGTARRSRQTGFMLKGALIIIFLACAAIVLYSVGTIFSEHRKRRRDPLDDDDYSPLTNAVIDCIEEKLQDTNFCFDDVLKSVGKSEEEVAAAIEKDLGCTFDNFLIFRRIKRSQKLMKDQELTIDQIATLSGFADIGIYKEQHIALMKNDPEISRAAVLEKIREEEEERRLDEEDDY
jgi:AraC-like DNA-binding protein